MTCVMLFVAIFMAVAPISAQKAHFGGVVTDVCNLACSGASQPYGVAVDSASGQVYYSTLQGDSIYLATPGASTTSAQDTYTVTRIIQSSGLQINQLARDTAGNLFVSTASNKAIYEFQKTASGYGAAIVIGTSLSAIGPLAVNPSTGTVFYLGATASAPQAILRIERNAAGVYSAPVVQLTSTDAAPAFGGLTTDASGNLYATEPKHNLIEKLTRSASGVYSAPASVAITFTNPNAIAVDASGNLYLSRVNDATASANGVYEAVFSAGVYAVKPLYLETNTSSNFTVYQIAVDTGARAYFGGNQGVLRRYNPASVTGFGSVAVGASSSVQLIRFQIDQAVTLGASHTLAEGISGTDFRLDTTQTTCLGAQQATTPPVGNDHACLVSVKFQPSAAGLRKGAVQLVDTNGAVVATAYIEGVATAAVATISPGTLTTVAGYAGVCTATATCGDGALATTGQFTQAIRVTYAAGSLYIADYGAHRIRKLDSATGNLTTIAGTGTACSSATAACGDGGLAKSATLKNPSDVAIDGAGNIFIADTGDNRLRRIDAVSGIITTVAGTGSATVSGENGLATAAGIAAPNSVAVDGKGTLYIAESGAHRVVAVAIDGILRRVAGTGTSGDTGNGVAATTALLNLPIGLATDSNDDLYIADSGNNRVKKVTIADGLIHYVAGLGGTGGYGGDGVAATSATLNKPYKIAIDAAGDVFIADSSNYRVRKVSAATGLISTVAGSGTVCTVNTTTSIKTCGDAGPSTVAAALLGPPEGVALDPSGNLVIMETGSQRLRAVSAAAATEAFASTAVGNTSTDSPRTVLLANEGNLPLVFAVPATSGALNPSISANFTYGNGSTCPQLGSASSSYSLASGASCTEVISFTPTAAGTITGSVVTTDNSGGTSGAKQTVPLTGTATASTAATHFTVTAPATATAGTSFATLTVTALTATNATATTYAGTVHFTSTDALATLPANARLTSGKGTFTATLRTIGSQTITATDTVSSSVKGTSGAIKVAGVAPTITFTIPAHTFGNADFSVTATSNSAGAFTYTVTSGPATIAAGTNIVHLTGSGTVVVLASQAANGIYTAGTKSATFTVAQGTAAITFALANHAYGDPDFTVKATSASTGAFTYSLVSGPATLAGTTVHITGVGTVMLKASQAAAGSYKANTLTSSFTVSPGTAAITFAVPNHVYGDADFPVSATSASTGAFTYSFVSGPATVTGNKVHLTGAGTVVLKASQAATTLYVANSATASFTVAGQITPITFVVPNHVFGDADFAVSANSASTGAYTYTLVSGPATVAGNIVHLTGAGTVVLQAAQAAAGPYSTNRQTATFTVAPGAAAITFSVPAHTFGDADFTVSASSASSGAYSYTVVSGSATVSGASVHLTGAGTVVLKATQTAAGNYAASSQTASFTVAKGTPVISWPQPAAITYGTALSAAQQTASAKGVGSVSLSGTFSYTPASGSIPLPPSQQLSVTFTPTDTTNYTVASATLTLTVKPATLTLSAANATRVYGIANPTFTGALSGQQNGDTFTESFATAATLLSPASTYAIVPSAAGTNLNRYTIAAQNGTLTITKAGTTATAVAANSSVLAGQSNLLTATIVSQTAGAPTGTVQFTDGTNAGATVLGTNTLTAGQVVFNASALSVGTHTVVVTYLGDGNFNAGATASLTIVVKTADFTFAPTGASAASFKVGQSAAFALRLTPAAGSFYQPIHLSYTANLPFYVRGSLSVTDVPAGAGPTDVTLTLVSSTTAAVAPHAGFGGTLALAALMPLLCFRRLRRKAGPRIFAAMMLLVGLGAAAAVTGCGTGYAAQSLPLTITATSGGITHSVTVTANVLASGQ